MFVDAGYRWAYWKLEQPGIVARKQSVNLSSVTAAAPYWQPEPGLPSKWLYDEVFPALKEFIRDHAEHHVVYGEYYDFLEDEADEILNWKQTGFLARESPRFWVENLHLRSWEAVVERVASHEDNEPWWWNEESLMLQAKDRFLNLVNGGPCAEMNIGPAA